MKKRSCERLTIPGTTLYYKNKPLLFSRSEYPDTYYPVLDFSRGGAKFLCDERLKGGTDIIVKLIIPGLDTEPELLASVRWISRNPEESYRYQTGIAFESYGNSKNQNPMEILTLMKDIEKQVSTGEES